MKIRMKHGRTENGVVLLWREGYLLWGPEGEYESVWLKSIIEVWRWDELSIRGKEAILRSGE